MFEKKTHNGKEYNQSTDSIGWKIVHNGIEIKVLSCDNSMVGTSYSVYFTPNFRSMMQYINTNNLDVSSIELDNYDKYFDSVVDGALLPNDNDLIDFLDTFNFI